MLSLASTIMGLALTAVGPQGGARRPGTVVISATFDRSEWTPPGRVTLDLRTGRYRLTPAPSRRQLQARIAVRERSGALAANPLARVRAAAETARSQGLTDPSCRGGRRPSEIIISNVGPIMMALSGADGTVETPNELACWGPAARGLYLALQAAFEDQVYPASDRDAAAQPSQLPAVTVIVPGRRGRRILLPESAVLSDVDGIYVFILDQDDAVVRREVVTGLPGDRGVPILRGLVGDERVVESAGAFLNPGERVRPESARPRR